MKKKKKETESQIRNLRQGEKWRSQTESGEERIKTNKTKNLDTLMLEMAAMAAEACRHTLPGCGQRKAPLFCPEVSRGEAALQAP